MDRGNDEADGVNTCKSEVCKIDSNEVSDIQSFGARTKDRGSSEVCDVYRGSFEFCGTDIDSLVVCGASLDSSEVCGVNRASFEFY